MRWCKLIVQHKRKLAQITDLESGLAQNCANEVTAFINI